MLFSRARSGAATSTTPTAGCCSTASRKSRWPKTMRWSSCPATCSRARSGANPGLTHFCRGGTLPPLGGRGKPRPYGLSRPRQQLVVVLTHGRRHLVEAAQLLRGVDAKRRGAEALIFDAGAIVGPEPDAIALHHAEHAALPVQGPTAHV